MCHFLFTIFGRDTRSAQVLNLILSTWWFLVLSLTGMGITKFDIPYILMTQYGQAATLFMLSMLVGMLSFVTCYRPRQILKTFALSLGMLNHAVLANAYLTEYPPLDMMMCVSTVLAIYFGFAVLYIFKCEGLDGVDLRR